MPRATLCDLETSDITMIPLSTNTPRQTVQPQVVKVQNGQFFLSVDEEPYLVLGGELSNSAMTSLAYMDETWNILRDMDINTLLGGVSWEQIEPTEGVFDFKELDKIILAARREGFRLVLLWFGTYKNGKYLLHILGLR